MYLNSHCSEPLGPKCPIQFPKDGKHSLQLSDLLIIKRNAKALKQIGSSGFTRLESTMNTAISNKSTMFTSKLQTTTLMVLKGIDKQLRIIPNLVSRVSPKSSQRVLGPMCSFNIDQTGQSLIRLRAEQLEQRFKKQIDLLQVLHGLDALRQRLRNLHTQLLAARHNPQV